MLKQTSNFSTNNSSDYFNLLQKISPTVSDLTICVNELNLIILLFKESTKNIQRSLNKLFDVFTLFLDNLHPETRAKRSVQLSAASLIGEIGFTLLSALENSVLLKANKDTTRPQQFFYDLLNDRIQNIATSTTNLVLQ